jgi:glutamate/tyrosine decarboxylase-like PLP-dependent enzyme
MSDVLARAAELAAEWLASLDSRPVGRPVEPEAMRARLAGAMPDEGEDPRKVINEMAVALEPGLVANPGPRYFGFVTGGSLPAALAADWLVSAWDQNSAMQVMSPAVAAVEEVAAGWLLDVLGLPARAAVGFVTGGQMANFTCLAAGRDALLAGAGWDVAADGLTGAPEITVLAGAQAHATIWKALRLLGLGPARARRIPADSQGRMIAEDLRRELAAVTGPALVCAQAGEVNTGAMDPLGEIAGLVRRRPDTWLHVDGAFGLWAAASPALRPQLAGAELADSWATDAHKWLNVPYDCGLAIVADPGKLTAALGLSAAYLPSSAARDAGNLVPEASRRARALPVYAALRALGRRGLAAQVDRCCALARRAADGLADGGAAELLNDVTLNQVLFRVPGASADDVIQRVQQDGTCWLGGTAWQGAKAIRLSVSGWPTTEADIDRSVAAIRAAITAAVSAGPAPLLP